MRPRISIRGSVRPSVRPSVGPSVRPSVANAFVKSWETRDMRACYTAPAQPPRLMPGCVSGLVSWKTCFGKLIGEPKNAFFSLKFFLDITNSHLIQFCVSWYKVTLTGPRVLHRVGNLECIFYCWNPIFLCSGTLIFIKFNFNLVWLFGKLQ